MLNRQLDDFFDFLDLLIETADHVVRRIWYFLYHHERYERIDFTRQDFIQLIRVTSQGNAQPCLQRGLINGRINVGNVLAFAVNLHE